MKVCVLGVGGLGSTVANLLAERFASEIDAIHLIDSDTVEPANLGTQAYTERDVGSAKVIAMQRQLALVLGAEKVFAHQLDINHPNEHLVRATRECTVYIAAVDNYQSRVNFYHHLVSDSASPSFLYIDGGSEKFRGHCFYTTGQSSDPCIYCIGWLFPEERQPTPLCSLRNVPSGKITPEMRGSVLMALLEQERGKDELSPAPASPSASQASGEPRRHCPAYLYQAAADRFNAAHGETVGWASAAEVEELASTILPTVSTTNTIIANLVVWLVRQRGARAYQGNFILYSGDQAPTFHRHRLEKRPGCFLCSA